MHFYNASALCTFGAATVSTMETANQRLKDARIKAGFETAKDAAESMGIPIATYSQHENGRRGFPAKRAPQYARKFKVSAEYLLYGKGEGPSGELSPRYVEPLPLPTVADLAAILSALKPALLAGPETEAHFQALAWSIHRTLTMKRDHPEDFDTPEKVRQTILALSLGLADQAPPPNS